MDGKSPGPFCGRKIKATNKGSDDNVGGAGRSVTVTVKDTCPSCKKTHLDFSVGAWYALTDNAAFGTINIEWHVFHPVNKQDCS
jgi:expansin (peptidoglycan-binding protein)